MTDVATILRMAPVIPVLVIDDVASARAIAEALVAGGLPVLEVTLRTPAALAVIEEMARVPGAIVGAGTVLNARAVDASVKAGAQFLVSPGLTDGVANEAANANVPLLPGIATASDIMRGLDRGLTNFKFFPAIANGGVPALKSLIAPFGQVRFCPTGGITLANAPEFLALPEVLCVGGSWLVPPGVPDLAAITKAALAASGLRAH